MTAAKFWDEDSHYSSDIPDSKDKDLDAKKPPTKVGLLISGTKQLSLMFNDIDEDGGDHLAMAIEFGALPSLVVLKTDDITASDNLHEQCGIKKIEYKAKKRGSIVKDMQRKHGV